MKIIECPRDAMQGFPKQIETKQKVDYINQLLRVGFHTIDFGSFVSPKAIPQMADTKEVLSQLNLNETSSELLAIIANIKGAETGVTFPEIKYLGYPFSISETFQLRNTKKTIADSQLLIKDIKKLLTTQELVVYISMGFGNPYGDHWNTSVVERYVDFLVNEGITTISLADTLGMANTKDIESVFNTLSKRYEGIEFGAHFHSTPQNWQDKTQAAYDSGCLRFDVAMKGYGGCPFADDHLVGNTATEQFITWMEQRGLAHSLDMEAFNKALAMSSEVFKSE